jgi:hypothetical protein
MEPCPSSIGNGPMGSRISVSSAMHERSPHQLIESDAGNDHPSAEPDHEELVSGGKLSCVRSRHTERSLTSLSWRRGP